MKPFQSWYVSHCAKVFFFYCNWWLLGLNYKLCRYQKFWKLKIKNFWHHAKQLSKQFQKKLRIKFEHSKTLKKIFVLYWKIRNVFSMIENKIWFSSFMKWSIRNFCSSNIDIYFFYSKYHRKKFSQKAQKLINLPPSPSKLFISGKRCEWMLILFLPPPASLLWLKKIDNLKK